MKRKETDNLVKKLWNENAIRMALADIKELGELLLASTAKDEDVLETKSLMGLEDTEDNPFALVWENIGQKGYLVNIPMITLRKADNVFIFYLLDEDPIVPKMVEHTEMTLAEIVSIRNLMRDKLEEVDIRNKVWSDALFKYGILLLK
jgi:hypothetical protein